VISSNLEKQQVIQSMVSLTYDLKRELNRNNTHSFGEILHENWTLKKSLTADISRPEIEEWYHDAIKSGAIGGKILGAGNGGFLMFYAPKSRHLHIRQALSMLRHYDVKFERLGSRIIFYN